MSRHGRMAPVPRRRVHVPGTHRRWCGPRTLAPAGDPAPPGAQRRARIVRPVLDDDVARRLVVAGLPDRVAGALLLAVLPSHLAEAGGRRLVSRAVEALHPHAEGARAARP